MSSSENEDVIDTEVTSEKRDNEDDSSSDSSDDVDENELLNVEKALEEATKKYKPAKAEKEDDLQYDLFNLAAVDVHPIDEEKLKSNNEFLKTMSRDNVQLLMNQIFSLPGEGVLVELPEIENIKIPREKPLPKEKPPTKWEKFAKVKGINKRKKEGVEWDEATESWIPTYGFKSKKNDKQRDWLIEVNDKHNDGSDPFEEKQKKKKDQMTKQLQQERRNKANASRSLQKIAGDKKTKIFLDPSIRGGKSKITSDKFAENLKTQIMLSKQSTASFGKFAPEMAGEPKMKKRKIKKDAVVQDSKIESEKNLKVYDRVFNKKKKDIVNIAKAVNQTLQKSNLQNRKRNMEKSKQNKKKK